MKKRIGISSNYFPPSRDRRFYVGKQIVYGESNMIDSFSNDENLSLMIPLQEDLSVAADYAECCDALVLTGGTDIDPRNYGEQHEGDFQIDRDHWEIALLKSFAALKKPVLGICRGMQLINVGFGGSLHFDINDCGVSFRKHRDGRVYERLIHPVNTIEGTRLSGIYGVGGWVNSVHHQSVHQVGENLRISALSDDGVVEAVELESDENWILGVQWHPEWIRGSVEKGLLPARNLLEDFFANI